MRHVNNFDALRLAAALCVMISHMFELVGLSQPMVVAGHNLGNWAVLVFFSISGYLVTQSWVADPDVKRFLMRRWLRLWPALAVVVGLGMLVLIPLLTGRGGLSLMGDVTFWKGFGVLSLWFNPSGIAPFTGLPEIRWNGPLWTIPKEFACYLMLMGFGLILRRNFARDLPWIALVTLVFYSVAFGQAGDELTLLRYTLSFWVCFMLGASLALHPAYLERALFWWGVAITALVLVFANMATVALLILTATMSVAIGRMRWPILSRVGLWGDFSYGTYLYGWPCQQLVIKALGVGAPFAVLLGGSVILAVGCGVFSWHLVEKPCLQLKPRKPV